MIKSPASTNVISVSELPLRGSRERKPLQGAPAKREKEILEAAVDLFHANGYSGTSVEHVANAAGMLKGSLYHYIDTKEDLLYRIVELVHEGHERMVADVASRTDLGPTERLDLYFRSRVRSAVVNRRRITVYWQDRERLSPERLDKIEQWRSSNSGFVLGLVEEAKAAGELPAELDAVTATSCLRGVLVTLHVWCVPSPTVPIDALAQFTSNFLLEGLRGSGAPDIPQITSPPTTSRPRSKRKRRT
jgi:AcrR family transcriptional regulator